MSSIDSAGIQSQIPLQAKYPDIGGVVSENMSKAFELQDLYKQRQLQQQQLQFQNQSEMQRLGMEHERLNLENKRLDAAKALQDQLYQGQRDSDKSEWMSDQITNAWEFKERKKQEFISGGMKDDQAEAQAQKEVAPLMRQIKVSARDVKDARGAPLFDQASLQKLDQAPEQFDDAKLGPIIASNPKALARQNAVRAELLKERKDAEQQKRLAEEPKSDIGKIEADVKKGVITRAEADKRIAKLDAPPAYQFNLAQGEPQGKTNLTGDDYLKSLPTGERQIVKKVANYEINPQSLSSIRGERKRILEEASIYNPEYDQTNYAAKQTAITKFSSGAQGDKTRSFNVAIEHLDTLQRAGAALKNNNVKLLNEAKNIWQEQTGKPGPGNFDAVKDLVSDEVVSAIVAGRGGLADREAAQKKIDAAKSPDQLAGVIYYYKQLFGGQLKGLEQEYKSATGLSNYKERFLTEHGRKAAEEAGASSDEKDPLGIR